MAVAISAPNTDTGHRSWQEKYLCLRNNLLRNAAFQRWAATFPLTRLVARRQARAAFDLCAGFVYSQILAACIKLDILERLARQPCSTATLAEQCALPRDKMERLLSAASALNIVVRTRNDRWSLGMTGAAISGTPGLADMIRHHAILYSDLQDPVALLRAESVGTGISRYWPYSNSHNPLNISQEAAVEYSELMSRSQVMISNDIISAYSLNRHRKLIDLGGGEGAFISAVAAAAPGIQLSLFDLPSVTSRARRRLAGCQLDSRVEIISGNFFKDTIPGDADIATLVRVVHDHDDEDALTLLQNIHRALPPNGRLLIAEPMAGTPGAKAIGDAYFGFYLLAMGSGRPRTPKMISDLAQKAGFRRTRLLSTARPMLVRAIVCDA